MPTPAISVILSVYNEKPRNLDAAIRSILVQTFSDFEFIIVDDASTDSACKEVLQSHAQDDQRIILLRNKKNYGLAASLNRALARARAGYIARIDSDDLTHPTRLARQHDFMQKHPAHALCGSWSYLINDDDEIVGRKIINTAGRSARRMILFFNPFTHSSLFFRRKLAQDCGNYSEDIRMAQDYDLILKLSARHAIANVTEFLCFHRVHRESLSAQGKKKQEWYALRARWRAVTRYGHSPFAIWKLLPALVYFVAIPHRLEKLIFHVWHFRH